jgi:hypothetical protein
MPVSDNPDIPEIITRRLASGRRMPWAIVKLSKGWTSFGVTHVPPGESRGFQLSPTEFGYRTIVWLGRVMVMVRRKV